MEAQTIPVAWPCRAAPAPAQPGAGPTPSLDPPPEGSASAGCAISTGIVANPAVPNTILTFPPAYDGRTPVPLVFAFHGAGRTNEDMRDIDSRTNGGVLEDNYVVAYMKSAGNGWDIGADYPRFDAALDQILSEQCIDTGSIFAFGHSSGAQFIVQLLGDSRTRETRFAGVVPVASSRFNNPVWTPLPTLVIHGLNDNQRNGDRKAPSVFRKRADFSVF
jgi:poly(3-hydroxybutyrate) depolymerase